MVTLDINGQQRSVRRSLDTPVLWVLREDLTLRGTKYGCVIGVCGISIRRVQDSFSSNAKSRQTRIDDPVVAREFQDPANGAPWVDGEYLWIWGGPYEARDELYSKFGDVASEALIEEVVE